MCGDCATFFEACQIIKEKSKPGFFRKLLRPFRARQFKRVYILLMLAVGRAFSERSGIPERRTIAAHSAPEERNPRLKFFSRRPGSRSGIAHPTG